MQKRKPKDDPGTLDQTGIRCTPETATGCDLGVVDRPSRDIDSALRAIRYHLKMDKAVAAESTAPILSVKVRLLDRLLAKISTDCERLFGVGSAQSDRCLADVPPTKPHPQVGDEV
jgi:hypothetical protein